MGSFLSRQEAYDCRQSLLPPSRNVADIEFSALREELGAKTHLHLHGEESYFENRNKCWNHSTIGSPLCIVSVASVEGPITLFHFHVSKLRQKLIFRQSNNNLVHIV